MDKVLILLLIVLTLSSYINLKKKLKKHSKEDIKSLMSGFEVSRKILDKYDLNNVYITESRQSIISHYDTERQVIRLTNGVFNDTSISSCAVSSLQSAYAIEHKKNDKWFIFREKINPLLKVILYFSYIVLFMGILFGNLRTIYIGIALEYAILIFHVLTYKIEKNSIKIAQNELLKNKIITKKELEKVKEILQAHSYIGVASIILPIAELLKRMVEFGNSNR